MISGVSIPHRWAKNNGRLKTTMKQQCKDIRTTDQAKTVLGHVLHGLSAILNLPGKLAGPAGETGRYNRGENRSK